MKKISKPIFDQSIIDWIEKYNLNQTNTDTLLGQIASPKLVKDWEFTLESPQETLLNLNNLYGTQFDEAFLNIKGVELKFSLIDIEEQRIQIKKLSKLLPREFGNYQNPYFSICGIKNS